MIKLITTLVIALFTLIGFAQSSTTSTKTSSSYSISIDTDDDKNDNTSVSVKSSDDILRLKASFSNRKTNKVKEILLKRLGKNNLKIKGNTYQWINNDNEFECKLSNGNLFIIVDKQVAANHFFKEINTLVNDLRYIISGKDPKKEEKRDKERAKRDMERAQRDLERAERDLERAKRDLERAKNN